MAQLEDMRLPAGAREALVNDTELFERYQRSEKALVGTLMEMAA